MTKQTEFLKMQTAVDWFPDLSGFAMLDWILRPAYK